MYLKECFRITQHFVSGNRVFKTDLPLRLVAGLPGVIPGVLRLRMKAGDADTIRGCLALLSIFRVLKVPSVLKLGTITDPFKGLYASIPSLEIGKVFRTIPSSDFKTRAPIELLRLNTSGPNGSVSVLNTHFDVMA